jgi:hypothetical protein
MNRMIGRIGMGLFGIALLAAPTWGQVPADEQAFLDKHMNEVVAITPKRLSDAAVTKSFSAPVYELNITINSGDGGTMSQKQIAAKVDDKLVPVARPGTDQDCPQIFKMVNPAFVLKTDDDAKTMQAAMDAVFPPVTDDEKKGISFSHSGSTWTFYRGMFFNNKLGFVITTDGSGKVTAVKFALKL